MLPLGLRQNNPGNIRPLPGGQLWQGQTGSANGFCIFATMPDGVRALAKNLLAYYEHDDGKGGRIDTVSEAIARWAPPKDRNNTEAYIAFVCSVLKCGPDDEFDFHDRDFLFWMITAIGEEEQGHDAFTQNVSDDDIQRGIDSALSS